jgi:hypothetical protein
VNLIFNAGKTNLCKALNISGKLMRKRLKCLYPNVNALLTSGIKPYEVRFDATAVAAEGPDGCRTGEASHERQARQGCANGASGGGW